MPTTATLTGAVPSSDGRLHIVLRGSDTDAETREVLTGYQLTVELEENGAVPAGTLIWRNDAGVQGTTTYDCWLSELPSGAAIRSRRWLASFRVEDADTVDIGDLVDQAEAPDPVREIFSTLTQGQYDRAIGAVAEAEGHAAVSRQAAGEATAGIVALALSAEAGAAATSPGDLFAVGVDAAGDDPARLDLYINDAGTARLLPIEFRPSAPLVPLKPATPAALTVEARADKRGTVKLRQVVGWNHNLADNASPALNAALPYLSENGLGLVDTDGLDLRCYSQVKLYSGLRFDFSPQTTFRRYFGNSAPGSKLLQALFHPVDASVDILDLSWRGGRIIGSPDYPGILLRGGFERFLFEDVQFLEFYGGQGMFFTGQKGQLIRVISKTAATETGTAPFRFGGGEDVDFFACYGEGGDDLYQVCIGAVDGLSAPTARELRGAKRIYFFFCRGKTALARLALVAFGTNSGNTVARGKIEDILFFGLAGEAKQLFAIGNGQTGDRIYRQVDNIRLINSDCKRVTNDVGKNIGTVSGYHWDAIGRVLVENCTMDGEYTYGVGTTAKGAEITLRNNNWSAILNNFRVRGPSTVLVEGGEYLCGTGTPSTEPDLPDPESETGGGTGTGSDPVDGTGGSNPLFVSAFATGVDPTGVTRSARIEMNKVTLRDIPSGYSGGFIAVGHLKATDVLIEAAVGATDTKLFGSGSSATIEHSGLRTGSGAKAISDLTSMGAGTILRGPVPTPDRKLSVLSAGVVAVAAKITVIGTGGGNDVPVSGATLPSWVGIGDRVFFKSANGGQDPILQHMAAVTAPVIPFRCPGGAALTITNDKMIVECAYDGDHLSVVSVSS